MSNVVADYYLSQEPKEITSHGNLYLGLVWCAPYFPVKLTGMIFFPLTGSGAPSGELNRISQSVFELALQVVANLRICVSDYDILAVEGGIIFPG
jgi:hypothetical protein